jgi:hypothetical protein
MPVDLVEKQEAGISGLPSGFHDPIEKGQGIDGASDSTGSGIAQAERHPGFGRS